MQTELTTRSQQQITNTSKAKSALSSQSLSGLAKPIFDFNHNIKQIGTEKDIDRLTDQAITLLNTFLKQTEKCGYHRDTSLFSEYILASFLDCELNAKSQDKLNPIEICQLLPQAKELDHKFKQALHAMQKMPQAFIDVIELVYLCQSLSTHFKLIGQGEELTLYDTIQQTRGEFDRRLSKPAPGVKTKTQAQKARFVMMISIVSAVIVLGGVFASFGLVLYSSEQPLKQTLNTLTVNNKGK